MINKRQKVSIENTRFIFTTNFSGDPSRDRFGSNKRRVNLVLTEDMAHHLMDMGVTVKQTRPNPEKTYDESFLPTYFVPVNVNMESKWPPHVYWVTTTGKKLLCDIQENLYADFSNQLKNLARKARLEAVHTENMEYNPAAAKEYRTEVQSIDAKLKAVIDNKPKERRAMIIANANIKAKIQAQGLDPKKDKKEIKKISAVEMQRARDSVGASGSKTRITFTDREWEAVQAGAITHTKLTKILNASKPDEIVKRAMPKTATVMTNAKMAKAKAMLANGYTYNEIAKACGVPESTVYSALNK